MSQSAPPPCVMPTSCKAVFGSKEHDVRRFTLPPDSGFEYLSKKLTSIHPEAGKLTIKYLDDEEDYVTIADEEDYQVALGLCTESIFRVCVSVSSVTSSAEITASPEEAKCKAFRELMKKHPNMRKGLKHELCKQAWKEQKQAWKTAKEHTPGNPRKALARFVSHVTVPDGTRVTPGERLTKSWRVRNDGQQPWPPEGVGLLFVSGNSSDFNATEVAPITTAALLPGQEADIGVDIIVPTAPGAYQGFWRLQGPKGCKFGQRLGCSVHVVGEDSSTSPEEGELADGFVEVSPNDSATEVLSKKHGKKNQVGIQWTTQMLRLNEQGFTDTEENARLLNKFNGNVERTIEKLVKRAAKAEAKLRKHADKA